MTHDHGRPDDDWLSGLRDARGSEPVPPPGAGQHDQRGAAGPAATARRRVTAVQVRPATAVADLPGPRATARRVRPATAVQARLGAATARRAEAATARPAGRAPVRAPAGTGGRYRTAGTTATGSAACTAATAASGRATPPPPGARCRAAARSARVDPVGPAARAAPAAPAAPAARTAPDIAAPAGRAAAAAARSPGSPAFSRRSMLVLGFAGVGIVYARTDVPDPDTIETNQVATIYYADGKTVLARVGSQNRSDVQLSAVPPHVKWAVLAAENRSFYTDPGISPKGITRAAWNNVRGGELQGGSTITQQYVKNVFTGGDRTFARKFKELFVTVKLDRQYSKDQILEWYLNTIYFGRGAYGVQAAAQVYFGKPLSRLTVAEGAVLASSIRSPALYDPQTHPEAAKDRWRFVAQRHGRHGEAGRARGGRAEVPAGAQEDQRKPGRRQARPGPGTWSSRSPRSWARPTWTRGSTPRACGWSPRSTRRRRTRRSPRCRRPSPTSRRTCGRRWSR